MLKLPVFTAFICLSFLSFAQQRCHTTEYINNKLINNPELIEMQKTYLNSLSDSYASQYFKQSVDQIVHIPVVFHIIYNSNAQNVDDARLFEQIERLNMDFSGTNSDTAIVPEEFKPFIADTKIRFYFATTDPDGNPTTGITRTLTTISEFDSFLDEIKSNTDGGKDAWNTNKYLNIWIGSLKGNVLGYSTKPFAFGTDFDGVVIDYQNIGNNSGGIFDLGRTATHEVGHYFGLDHVWGSGGGSCILDDGFTDTPDQFGPHYGVNTHPLPSCGSNDMFMNYMDYGNDESLVMFSKEQKTEMELTIDGVRSDLGIVQPLSVENVTKSDFQLFPNPNSGNVNLSFATYIVKGKVSVLDISGREYFSESIVGLHHYNIDLSNLTNGFYFVSVYDGNTTSQRKMVVKK